MQGIGAYSQCDGCIEDFLQWFSDQYRRTPPGGAVPPPPEPPRSLQLELA